MSEKISKEGAEWVAPSEDNELLENREEVAALRAFEPLLTINEKLDNAADFNERKYIYRETTEDQFLITHYVWQNAANPKALREFWDGAGKIAEVLGKQKEFFESKKGIITQVAALHALKALGENPELAHPEQDAYDAIDMWADPDSAVQIKGAPVERAAIIESDVVSFPAIKTTNPKSEKFYGAKFEDAAKRFNVKTKEYEKRTGKHIKSYFLVLPIKEIDVYTGRPSVKLVSDLRRLLGKESEPTSQAA